MIMMLLAGVRLPSTWKILTRFMQIEKVCCRLAGKYIIKIIILAQCIERQ